MSRYTGKNCSVTVGGNAVGSVESINIDETAAVAEAMAFGDTYSEKDVGNISASGSITFFDDPEDTSGQGAFVIGSELALIIYPRGSTNTASPTESCNIIVQTRNRQQVTGFVKVVCNFVVNGAVTRVAS